MKLLSLTLMLVIFLSAGWTNTQKKSKLSAKGSEIKKEAGGFKFTEGPAVAPDGKVYFVDQPNDRIHLWDENKENLEAETFDSCLIYVKGQT